MAGPFVLQRDQDISGVSGTGLVAWGFAFPDGVCALRWAKSPSASAFYNSIEDLETIHGHGGATKVVWI